VPRITGSNDSARSGGTLKKHADEKRRLLVLKGKDVEFEACGGHLSSFFVRGVEIVARKKSCKENLEWILWQDREWIPAAHHSILHKGSSLSAGKSDKCPVAPRK